MISNHYPLLFATRYNWLIVAILLALGPIIRHFFNDRHAGKEIAVVGLGRRRRRHDGDRAAVGGRPREVEDRRACRGGDLRAGRRESSRPAAACAMPPSRSGPTIATAPKAMLLDDAEHIHRNARLIGRNAAWSSAMPPGNVTEMTAAERATMVKRDAARSNTVSFVNNLIIEAADLTGSLTLTVSKSFRGINVSPTHGKIVTMVGVFVAIAS